MILGKYEVYMNLKKETKNIIKFGCKNSANRKKAIKSALTVIEILT